MVFFQFRHIDSSNYSINHLSYAWHRNLISAMFRYYATVTPCRIALPDVRQSAIFWIVVRRRFLSFSCSSNAFLVRRCLINMAGNVERTSPDKGVRWLYGCCALGMRLVRNSCIHRPVLVSSHPLTSDGPDSRPDYCYLKLLSHLSV